MDRQISGRTPQYFRIVDPAAGYSGVPGSSSLGLAPINSIDGRTNHEALSCADGLIVVFSLQYSLARRSFLCFTLSQFPCCATSSLLTGLSNFPASFVAA